MIRRVYEVICDNCSRRGPHDACDTYAERFARKRGWRCEQVDTYGNTMHLCPMCNDVPGLWDDLCQGRLPDSHKGETP